MYYVYILHSDNDQGLYIGFSGDLSERLKWHNSGRSQSTASRCPLRLIYYP
ncbi:MAG: GIY-YIG nuclease family protein [Opitutaceae bacterium]